MLPRLSNSRLLLRRHPSLWRQTILHTFSHFHTSTTVSNKKYNKLERQGPSQGQKERVKSISHATPSTRTLQDQKEHEDSLFDRDTAGGRVDPLSEYFSQYKKYNARGVTLKEEAEAMNQVNELKEKLRVESGATDADLEDEYVMSEIMQMRRQLADAYLTLAQNDRAVDQWKRLVELHKDAYGPVSEEVYRESITLRDLLKDTGRYIEAADVQNSIIQLHSRLTQSYATEEARNEHEETQLAQAGAYSAEIGREWYELGTIYREMQSFEASEQAFTRAQDIFEAKFKSSSSGQNQDTFSHDTLSQYYFVTQTQLGHIQYHAKNYEGALNIYKKAIQVPLELDQLKENLVAAAAAAAAAADDDGMAKNTGIKSMDDRQRQWKLSIIEYVIDTYTNMGNCCLYLGMTDDAETNFKLAIKNSAHNQEKTASLLHSLSVLYGMLTQEYPDTTSKSFLHLVTLVETYSGDAIKILSKELEELDSVPLNASTLASVQGRKKLKQLTEYVQCHITLGSMYTRVQKLQQAESNFNIALKTLDDMQNSFKSSKEGSGDTAVATTVMPNLRKDMAFIFNHLAQIHQKRNNPQDALEMYKKAVQLAKAMSDKTNPILGTICRNVGVLYMTEYERLDGGMTKETAMELAENKINESYDLFHNAYPTEYHPDLGDIAKQLGLLNMKKHEWRAAMQHLEDSIDTFLVLDDKNPRAARIDECIRLYRDAAKMWQMDMDKKLEQKDLSAEEKTRLEDEVEYIASKLRDAKGKENVVNIKRGAKIGQVSGQQQQQKQQSKRTQA